MNPSAELRARVLDEVSRDRAPSRAEFRARNTKLFASAIVVPLVLFLVCGGVRGSGRPDLLVAETFVGASVIAVTALMVVLKRGRSMLGRPAPLLFGLALVIPIVLVAWKLGVTARFPGMMERWPERIGYRCLLLSCLMVAWPLVAVILVRRGSDPVHPRLTGAAIGAAVGACVWVMVDLWCPVGYVPHVMLGHALPVVLSSALGTWLGRFVALRRA
jgi:hypothetical protein